ncbi:MAG TPA: ComEC/Rec2 family competence protein [bacterium]|nr:ComEC/Rec2 family competence protein [bacterium]
MNIEILILFSFVLGIVLNDFLPFYYIFSLLPLFFISEINRKFIIIFLLFFLSGYYITENYKRKLIPEKIDFSQNSVIEGEIINIKEKKFEREIVLNIKKIYKDNENKIWKGKVLLKTRNNDKLLPGENLRIKEFSISKIYPPKNPSEFNYKKFMERQGIFYLIKSDSIEKTESRKNLRLLNSYIREKIEKRIENYMKFNPDGYEIVKLITIGSDDPPDFLKEIGIKSGIYHLFVISGIHIIFLILFFKILFIPFQKINNTHPKFFPFLLLFILWFYDFLCGFKIPVTRAVLMVSFYLIFEIFERKIEPIKSIILAGFLLLFINPYNIYSISFLLSFLSTFGILIIPGKIKLKRNFITNSFISTFSAQLFILPVLFYNFGFFYPFGILNNLLFTPLVGFLTINSFISIFLPFLFFILNFATNIFLKLLIFISNFSLKVNVYFPLFFILIYYFSLFIIFVPLKKSLRFITSFLIILLLVFFQVNLKENKKEEVIFFSLKNPFILINKESKGILITSNKIENPVFYKSTLYKLLKEKKIKIEKAIITGKNFSENLIFISKYCKNIYISDSILKPCFFNYENIKSFHNDDKIITDNFLFSFKKGNLLVKYDNFKFLIILDEDLEKSITEDKYFLIYLVAYKKNNKNDEIINSLQSPFLILQKETKKFENLKSLCQNYHLNKSSIILNLKTGMINYWRTNDIRKY